MWNGHLCLGIFITVLLTSCRADTVCNGSHEETVYPKLYHNGGMVNVRNIADYSLLTMVFTWRNDTVHVILEQHTVVLEDAVLELHDDNGTMVTEQLDDNNAHFQGHVLGARFSFVAIAIGKQDMTGYVQFDGEGIYIEHVVAGQLGYMAKSCGHTPYKQNRHRKSMETKKRLRRAPSQYTKFLEVLLVADSTVVAAVGKTRVKTYLLTLMNIVNEVYHDPTLGVNIEVVTVKIIFMDKATEGHVIVTSDPQRTVDQFCYWASTQTYRSRRYARETRGSNHDTAVLLTRHKFTAAGYAPITGMCVPMRNCAFVRDDGFSSAFVLAHEVGHIFGLMHDGHGNKCYGRDYTTSIMATMVQSAFNRYWWSGCSKTRMHQVIGGLTCLNNNPHHVIREELPAPVGIGWSLDVQCQLEFGPTKKHCKMFGGKDPCAQMWCTGDYAYTCTTKNVVPLEGTQCGPTKQWYCTKGACGYHGNQKALAGAWGEWGQWSNCSADCGVGFKRRSRLCDSPKPLFGGEDCDGESENMDTCKAKTVGCDGVRGSQAKEDKCGVCNGDGSTCKTVSGVYSKIFQYSAAGQYYETILVLPKGSRDISIAENGVSPHFMSVQDTVYYEHVINADGKQGSSQNFVLEGAWFKYYNNGGYEKLDSQGPIQRDVNVMIYPTNWKRPANVRYSYTVDNNDFTYEKNKYQWKFEDWSECSVTCGEGGVQHIIYGCYDKENGKKMASDSCQFVDNPNSDDVECTRPECATFLYIWRLLRNHSECTSTCGDEGVHHLLYACEERATNLLVDDYFCTHIPQPIIPLPCNRIPCVQATYRWEVTADWSDCSVTCGATGTQHQLYYCIRMTEGVGEEKVEERFCSDMVSPKEPRACNRVPCLQYKWTVFDEWYDCNQTCGETGMQKRKVLCQKYEIGKVEKNVGIWYCRNQDKPTESRPCNVRTCYTYTWEESKEWGDCSQTCGEGAVRENTHTCKNVTYDNRETRVSNELCDISTRPNVTERCTDLPACDVYIWVVTTNWTECTTTCGTDGLHQRLYQCVTMPSNKEVPDTFCNDTVPPIQEAPCNISPCPEFQLRHVDRWYPECPLDCTDPPVPQQTRQTQCFRVYEDGHSEITEDEYCLHLEEPSGIVRPCEVLICSSYGWEESGWSVCSESCGKEGVESLTAQCVETTSNGTRLAVEEIRCKNRQKLDVIQRPCRLPPCLRYTPTSDWSTCSVTCDIGHQSRDGICVRNTTEGSEVEVPVEMCEAVNITKPRRNCDSGPCFLEWGAGPWSMCSKTCGEGRQKRIVYCGDALNTADPSKCLGLKPNEYQDCNVGSCRGTSRHVCRGDRAQFCKKANLRLCSHPAFKRVCCESCRATQMDQPRFGVRNYWTDRSRHFRQLDRPRSRYRNYWAVRRRHFRRV